MAIIQVSDNEYEVLAECKKCKSITPHRWIVYDYYGKDWEIILREEFICKNCGRKTISERVIGRL